MPIGGNNDTFTITGAKLKVDQGVQVGGSITYTTLATGFGSVTAEISSNNTLNITSGKNTGVAKIERTTPATITTLTHTNVNNNTTIHIALKNTSPNKGDFITLGTFTGDDSVKVNYTDEYSIGPGETGMVTVRKVNNVASVFIREMFNTTSTDLTNKPFYIKSGVNYKYPLYASTGGNTNSVTIDGVNYWEPAGGHTTKSRPPKGLPEKVVETSVSGVQFGLSGKKVDVSVEGGLNTQTYAQIRDNANGDIKTNFFLEDGEGEGAFTETSASARTYKVYVDGLATSTTTSLTTTDAPPHIVFLYNNFADSSDPFYDLTVSNAAVHGRIYADTPSDTYSWGTLGTPTKTTSSTTYSWTPTSTISNATVLLIGGGGSGGCGHGGGGGAGGVISQTVSSIANSAQTIVVGNGGVGPSSRTTRGVSGTDTTAFSLTAIGGGGGASNNNTSYPARDGGSGGGGSGGSTSGGAHGSGTAGQGNDGGAKGSSTEYPGGGGGAGAAGTGGGTGRGHGGDGVANDITGTVYYWAGGGGGAGHKGGPGHGGKGGGGGGGQGGGGNGGTGGITLGSKGTKSASMMDNDAGGGNGGHGTGGGGGGGGWSDGKGGNGGSGIVIIKGVGGQQSINRLVEISHVSYDKDTYAHVVDFKKTGTGDHIRYKIDNGSYADTASGVYTLSTTLTSGQRTGSGIKYTAYLADSSNNQLGTKKTFSYNPLTPSSEVTPRVLKITKFFKRSAANLNPNAELENISTGFIYAAGVERTWSNDGAGWDTYSNVTLEFHTTATNFSNDGMGDWHTTQDGSGNSATFKWEKSNDGGATWTNATVSSGSIGNYFEGNWQRYITSGAFTLDFADDSYEYRIGDV